MAKSKNNRGIVYILTNPKMPKLVKIGQTKNLSQRLKQVNNTSAPVPFECIYALEVDNYIAIERLLHHAFAEHRTGRRKEFFEVKKEEAIRSLKLFKQPAGKDVTHKGEDTILKTKKLSNTEKKPRFKFGMVGLKQGKEIHFHDDPKITAIIESEYQIIFENKAMSLSKAAGVVLKRRDKSPNVAGTDYWAYRGEKLVDRRERIETQKMKFNRSIKRKPAIPKSKKLSNTKKKSRFKFEMVGLKKGNEIHFYDEPKITAIIESENQVIFENKKMSLSKAAGVVLKRRGKSPNVAGTDYWAYRGEKLVNRRERIES